MEAVWILEMQVACTVTGFHSFKLETIITRRGSPSYRSATSCTVSTPCQVQIDPQTIPNYHPLLIHAGTLGSPPVVSKNQTSLTSSKLENSGPMYSLVPLPYLLSLEEASTSSETVT